MDVVSNTRASAATNPTEREDGDESPRRRPVMTYAMWIVQGAARAHPSASGHAIPGRQALPCARLRRGIFSRRKLTRLGPFSECRKGRRKVRSTRTSTIRR